MEKRNMIIVDSDERYIKNLMNYINKNYSNIFNTTCFTDYLYMEEYIKKQKKTDIILISLELFKDNISKLKDRFVIILTESLSEYDGHSCIKKYQSAEKICRDIIKKYEVDRKDIEDNKDTNVITFYSPIGGIGTSTLAISTAYFIGQMGKKVLYVNLENIQSTEIFLNNFQKSKYNLSDLIISIKNRSNNFSEILNSSINKYSDLEFYYFGVTDSILDIEELTYEDIKDLVENIQKVNLFDFVVFDLPSTLDTKYYSLFQKSNNVFVSIGQDKRSNYKIDTLLTQLDNTENFLFIVNKLNNKKEQLFPRIVSINAKPVIQTINFYEDIEGIYDIDKCFEICSEFKEDIEQIANDVLDY